jgi:hypothetical protein
MRTTAPFLTIAPDHTERLVIDYAEHERMVSELLTERRKRGWWKTAFMALIPVALVLARLVGCGRWV